MATELKPKTAAITIRKLDPKVVALLKTRAERAGRSMEEEARTIIEGAVTTDRAAIIDRFRRLRASIGPGQWDSVKMIEEARRERDKHLDEALGLPNPGRDPYYDDDPKA